VGEYIDGGVSGKYANRPGLDRLMADCRAGLIDVVIVAKHDRFGRSFRHTVALVGELEELGVEFVSIAERIDNTPSGRFQRNVLLSVAEFESYADIGIALVMPSARLCRMGGP
jgi:DNA invertase Pin-like site-specific DNA recombinase